MNGLVRYHVSFMYPWRFVGIMRSGVSWVKDSAFRALKEVENNPLLHI
jgi:hypothetical protein